MKLIGIGDSVVDYYKDQGNMYPGGNALNAAVFARRSGCEKAAYMGIVGRDVPGAHILDSLEREGLDIGRVRVVDAPSGVATVSLSQEGDRVFIASNKAKRAQSVLALKINADDLDYIAEYDVVHTSINSDLEHELAKLRGKAISFDFSTRNRWDADYLHQVCPYLTYAFFSGSDMGPSEIDDLFDFVHKLGVRVIGVTRGADPAIFSEGGKVFRQVSLKTEVVDTMGAGDSLIGAFLRHYHESRDLPYALNEATAFASAVCGYYGAFGYGKQAAL
ncbi:Sugar or nucleoside kinase, ribokinase family [Paenibacillus sp. UNCCL117]|uniref:PfkB family carbohydrate kinase n=1 Tax=unclassified Paenibacillus TaxID=185978 RepID=UPI000887B816|nr:MULTISPECIES: PfkB family carbohydrate kinase [unclassified Paenibacillus]SDE23192.1 Sugar or nucleoside kinase, ribokinase family [Paenibacillus sp. cl123]SFW42687.1 Sugar or nucleoside kinase, ribokinase family [Paenibacillus sp. UNCCL117]